MRQCLFDGVDSGDDIGPRLALDCDDDGRLGVHPARQVHILRSDDGTADIAHAHRPAHADDTGVGVDGGGGGGHVVGSLRRRGEGTRAVGEDIIVEPLRRHQLVVGLQRESLSVAIQCAFRLVDRGRGQSRPHRFEIEAHSRQQRRVDLNPDRRVLLAADADEADTRHLRDLLRQDAVGIIADCRQRQCLRSQRQHQHRRICRIGQPIDRRARHRRQEAGRRIDRRLHGLRRRIDRDAAIELQCDLGKDAGVAAILPDRCVAERHLLDVIFAAAEIK